MQQEFGLGEFSSIEQGHHTLLLHRELSDEIDRTVYFTLPGQDDYLYEYEGDLEEALGDLPEFYETSNIRNGSLTPEAVAVLEQIWNHFDRTGETYLQGDHEYDFQVQGQTLLILPKEGFGEVVAVDRNGQVESTLRPEQFGLLMERFTIAFQQMQTTELQQTQDYEWEGK